MKNRATHIMVTILVIMVAISVVGCYTSCNKEPDYTLVPTTTTTTQETTEATTEATTTTTQETTVETTETTIETTETSETTAETTVESNYKNNDIDFGNDKKAAETHKDNKGGKVTTTKAPSKKPATSTKKPTAVPTKKPATTKAPTNTPKPTEKPKPTATPVPSKGYAIVKVKVSSTVYVDDESDETEKKVDYFEVEATTSKWHTKTLSSYKYNGKTIDKKLRNKYGNNLQGYSAKVVEIVKFTN